MDDASYKDVQGNASMLAKEAVSLSTHLSNVGKEFRNIKKNDLRNFQKINKMFADKGVGVLVQNICKCSDQSR